MAIPQEYKLEDTVLNADNIVVRSATHPIHGKVLVYTPADSLPPDVEVSVKRTLYQNGVQMQNASQQQNPFLTRALEVSNNPNEPYIITEYTRYTLADLIDRGTKNKPKKAFQLCSHILKSLKALDKLGHCPDNFTTRQIRLQSLTDPRPAFIPIDAFSTQAASPPPQPTAPDPNLTDTATVPTHTPADDATVPVGDNKPQTQQPDTPDTPVAEPQPKKYIPRNIYILGDIAYTLIFADQYRLSNDDAADNIKKLPARWRTILDKALSPDLDRSYHTYDSMLTDIDAALARNKKIAFAVTPVLLALLAVASWFGLKQYNRHKIMTSEAGQAIESFLDIINETNSDFPPPIDRTAAPAEPNDNTILRPFERIPTLEPDE